MRSAGALGEAGNDERCGKCATIFSLRRFHYFLSQINRPHRLHRVDCAYFGVLARECGWPRINNLIDNHILAYRITRTHNKNWLKFLATS